MKTGLGVRINDVYYEYYWNNMKPFTMKTNKADIIIAANELLERQQVLVYLLIVVFSIGVLF